MHHSAPLSPVNSIFREGHSLGRDTAPTQTPPRWGKDTMSQTPPRPAMRSDKFPLKRPETRTRDQKQYVASFSLGKNS